MFRKVLIANRGVIACRIIRTLKQLGVRSVAVYSDADAHARHVREADEAYCVGPAPAAHSYLQATAILAIAQQCGADAIHPGYGFLSENAEFAQACEAQGIVFIGPAPEQMRAFGLKHTARALAQAQGVPLLPGSGLLDSWQTARERAQHIGYPVMLKSTAGGGGIGMRLVHNDDELEQAYASVTRLAQANFKDSGVYLEKFVSRARHIEVQIFGDGCGHVLALGERDCSIQRRNQKVIEEAPAPGLSESQRALLHGHAIRLAQAVQYRSAGTVEFVYDTNDQAFYFLEVNTRLQVEHGVTEQVYGIDLVEWMVRQAAGDMPPLRDIVLAPQGVSVQARIYAEDPAQQFQPCAGLLTDVTWPADVRVESWVERGTEVPAWYDPMLAKVIVTAEDRPAALSAMATALASTRLSGIQTNVAYLRQVIHHPMVLAGDATTSLLTGVGYRSRAVEVLEPGVHTTVQDWPGRLGLWDVGVPPSGPMDPFAHRMANRLLHNPDSAAALECTLAGPALRFRVASRVAITGAPAPVTVDDVEVPMWQAIDVPANGVLRVGQCTAGSRLYVAVAGGFDVAPYLDSASTFTLGQFGGHAGRCLRAADILNLGDPPAPSSEPTQRVATPPTYGHEWHIGVLYGPHGAPDFFTPSDIDTFFSTDWEVHYNSSRTGVRLIGPKPQWARLDGGEAGLHPSNIHDNAYAIGAIDFTGDMPVILGPDGPSLGGFVCPAVVVHAELWKMGQVRPGDRIRFHRMSLDEAQALARAQTQALDTLHGDWAPLLHDQPEACPSPVIHRDAARNDVPEMVIRQAGDRYLLVEFGDMVLDIELRMRVQALMDALRRDIQAGRLPGIIDLTPGIRSLQVHWDPDRISRHDVLTHLVAVEASLPPVDDMVVPSRVVHLPLCWDDPDTRLAIDKYMQSVRADAPWCPSNIEFIRRINGLNAIDDVFRIVFDARYLVLGLGDVYLGAPVATPIDPRHRLVTTKYNPARTWTPENAVGIGGAYLCVYGMEGPGGYQFVGRTLQMWNRWHHGDGHSPFDRPWLLRFFDQIRFYPVSHDELTRIRATFPHGGYAVQIEPTTFSLGEYRRFLHTHHEAIQRFKTQQQTAFEAERERWRSSGALEVADDPSVHAGHHEASAIPEGAHALTSSVPGSIWKVAVQEGQSVAEGDTLMVVESMKMEFNILAPAHGTVLQVLGREGTAVNAGQPVVILSTASEASRA